MSTYFDFSLSTTARCELVSITDTVFKAVRDSGLRNGLCIVSVPHTTAGVIVNENADPDVARDILRFLERSVPKDDAYRHAESNSDAHIKAIMTGSSLTLPLRSGELLLGTWQGIFFAEFDGPRRRSFHVDIVGAT